MNPVFFFSMFVFLMNIRFDLYESSLFHRLFFSFIINMENKFSFTTNIYHPNVNNAGEIQLDVLYDSWSPTITLKNVLSQIYTLMSTPDLSVRSKLNFFLQFCRFSFNFRIRWCQTSLNNTKTIDQSSIRWENSFSLKLFIDVFVLRSHVNGRNYTQRNLRKSVNFIGICLFFFDIK